METNDERAARIARAESELDRLTTIPGGAIPRVTVDDARYAELEAAARDMGADHGRAVGSWVIDGNTTAETAQRILDGYDDGDPEICNMAPAPLSGEWAGDPTPQTVLDTLGIGDADEDEPDMILEAYEMGFLDGYWDEVVQTARTVVDGH